MSEETCRYLVTIEYDASPLNVMEKALLYRLIWGLLETQCMNPKRVVVEEAKQ